MHIVRERLNINVEFCKSISIEAIENNYILIDLKNSEISLHNDDVYCFFCRSIKDEFLNFKGFLICENCLKSIKENEIGEIVY